MHFNKTLFILIACIALFLGSLFIKNFYEISESTIPLLWISIYLISGRNVFKGAFHSFKHKEFFDENVLMLSSSIAAFCIGAHAEAVSIMLFFSAGEYLQELGTQRAKKAISESNELDVKNARKLQNLDSENFDEVAPQSLKIGDYVLLKPGEMLSVDCEVLQTASLNCAHISGESEPVVFKKGAIAPAGCILLQSPLKLRVVREFGTSYISKIRELIANAQTQKSKTQNFITKFARIYTPIVFCVALLIAILPPLFFAQSWSEWIYRALVVMMVACPCALVISVPISYFGGLAAAAKAGALIKGANFLEALRDVKLIAFDKTGTLTNGDFALQGVICSSCEISESKVLQAAFLAMSHSTHPISESIVKILQTQKANFCNLAFQNAQEFTGLGIQAQFKNEQGGQTSILAGSRQLLQKFDIKLDSEILNRVEPLSGAQVFVAQDEKFLGVILIADTLKDGALTLAKELQKLGVKSVILSGDRQANVAHAAQILGFEYRAELKPEQKVSEFENLKAGLNGGKCAFVGDGINDAPVLALADVGVALKSGADVSMGAADVILNSLNSLAKVLKISRKTRTIIVQNIALALGIKILFVVLGVMGLASIWEAVFCDVGVALLALANAMRTMRV